MMKAIDSSEPAFPVVVAFGSHEQNAHQVGQTTLQCYGLSMRDYFAAKAVGGILADPTVCEPCQTTEDRSRQRQDIAEAAYGFADAMLAARKTEGSTNA